MGMLVVFGLSPRRTRKSRKLDEAISTIGLCSDLSVHYSVEEPSMLDWLKVCVSSYGFPVFKECRSRLLPSVVAFLIGVVLGSAGSFIVGETFGGVLELVSMASAAGFVAAVIIHSLLHVCLSARSAEAITGAKRRAAWPFFPRFIWYVFDMLAWNGVGLVLILAVITTIKWIN